MPIYEVTDPKSGKKLRLEGDQPPSEQELNEIFSTVANQQIQSPQQEMITANDLATPMEKFFAPIGRSMDKTIGGVKQLFAGDEEAEQIRQEQDRKSELWNANASGYMKAGEVASDIGQALIPATGGAKLMQGAGLAKAALAQGAIAGGLDAIWQKGEGAEEIDGSRTALVAGLGSLGEALSPVVSRLTSKISKPIVDGLRNKLSKLTGYKSDVELGAKVISELGQDPSSISRAELKELGKQTRIYQSNMSEEALVGSQEFGFNYTKGEATKDQNRFLQMAKEDTARGGEAGEMLRQMDERFYEQIGNASDDMRQQFTGGNRINNERDAAEMAFNELRSKSDEVLQSVDDAYSQFGDVNATIRENVVKGLPTRLKAAAESLDMPLDDLTPASKNFIAFLDDKVSSLSDDGLRQIDIKDVERIRRRLNNSIGASANPTDKRLAVQMKGEIDNWMDDLYADGLINGDEQSLSMLKEARALRAEYGKRFSQRVGEKGAGQRTSKLVEAIINNETTPDKLLSSFIGNGKGISNTEAAIVFRRLKDALGDDSEAINALREAVIVRLTKGKGVDAVSSALKDSLEGKGRSLLDNLFTQAQIEKLSRFKMAIDQKVVPNRAKSMKGSGDNRTRMIESILRKLGFAFGDIGAAEVAAGAVNTGGGWLSKAQARSMTQPLLRRQGTALAPASAQSAGYVAQD